jgi:hypothetical protein
MRRILWQLAPWQLGKLPFGRLALMPRQRHQVKAWVAWRPPATIGFDHTADNARMPEHCWKRDVHFDIERLRLGTKKVDGVGKRKSTGKVASSAVATKIGKPKIPKGASAPIETQKPLVEYFTDKLLWGVKTGIAHAKRRPHAEVMKELFALAASENGGKWGYDRANALFGAAEIAEEDDGPAFARFLNDENEFVARVAIGGVKKTGYKAAIPALAAMVNGRDGGRRGRVMSGHAATALKTLSGKRGASGILPYFDSEDARVREAACNMFIVFDEAPKLGQPYLEKALNDSDEAVAAAAKRALEKIAGAKAK